MSTHPYNVIIDSSIKELEPGSGKRVLDPHLLLNSLGHIYSDMDTITSVQLTAGNEQVIYSLNSFLSKNYDIEDDKIKFGFKRLKINGLRVALICELIFHSG